MLKFTTKGDSVILDKNILLTEEFTSILEHYKKAKNPDKGLKVLLYVYLCCDMSEDNFMKDLDFRQKPQQATLRCFKDAKHKFTAKEQELVDAAIDAYSFFNETAGDRAELAIDKKIDEARIKLEETELEIVRNTNDASGAVSFSSNNKILSEIAKDIDALMSLKLKIRETASKIKNTGRVRGDKGSSLIERNTFRNIVEGGN
jgi:hypothetical protein